MPEKAYQEVSVTVLYGGVLLPAQEKQQTADLKYFLVQKIHARLFYSTASIVFLSISLANHFVDC